MNLAPLNSYGKPTSYVASIASIASVLGHTTLGTHTTLFLAARRRPKHQPGVQELSLKEDIHALIKDLVRQHYERAPWKRGLLAFPNKTRSTTSWQTTLCTNYKSLQIEIKKDWKEGLQRDPSLVKSFMSK